MDPTPTLAHADEPLPQQVGRYRILERLGSGGMGTVYKAHDPHLDRTVAIKLPRIDGPQSDRLRRVQRFQREARLAARIWHPYVCPLYDVGEHDGQPFVVMPYIEGQSLAQRLTTQGRFENVSEAVEIALEVLAALGAVHRGGIIHRDLKDGNILLDPEGRAVLTDFGLARPENDTEHLTSDGIIVGTPSFMAPEVAAGHGQEVGPWTDLYSLAVVLYRMLTGRLPFEGPALTVLSRIANEEPVPPTHWRPELEPGLESVLVKALAREPRNRYQTAAKFAAALQEWCATTATSAVRSQHAIRTAPADAGARSATIAAEVDSTPSRSWRKRRWILPVGCLVSVFFLGGLIGVAFLFNHGRPTTSAASRSPMGDIKPVVDQTALIDEAEKGHLVRVQQILRTGIDPNVKNAKGETALMKAAAMGHIDVVKALLAPRGIPPNLEVNEIDNDDETALMKAAENGHVDVVNYLIERGVAVNLRDKQGKTALDKAKANNHTQVLEKLRQAGAKDSL